MAIIRVVGVGNRERVIRCLNTRVIIKCRKIHKGRVVAEILGLGEIHITVVIEIHGLVVLVLVLMLVLGVLRMKLES